MGLIRGVQIATGSDGIRTANLEDNVLSASTAGRAKIQDDYFDVTTATAKFTTSSIPNNRLVDPVLALSGGTMTGDLVLFGTPSTANSAARKVDVDRAVQGLDVKESVVLKSEANIANTGSITLSDFDGTGQGITLVAGDRVLLSDQTASAQNGIYQVVGTALTRSADADEDAEVTANMFTFIEEGTNADTGWVLVTDDPITVGTTGLTFSQFSGVGAVTFGTTISQVQAGVSAAGGTSSLAARSDHTHSIETSAGLGMSLSSSNSEGTDSALARADHDHAFLANEASQQLSVTSSNTVGTSDHFAHADHVHSLDLGDLGNVTGSTTPPQNVSSSNATGVSSSVFARADHIHDSPSWTNLNKEMVASTTTADGEQGTTVVVQSRPALNSYIGVKVNGIGYQVGDSTNSASADSYFSNDGGVSGLDFGEIVSGSTWHWNQSIANFNLNASSDTVDFEYLTFTNN